MRKIIRPKQLGKPLVKGLKNSLLVLQNFTTARKSGNILLTYLKAFFSSDTLQSMKTSDSDLKFNRSKPHLDIYFGYPLGHDPTFSYSDECRTKKSFQVCQKNVAAFSCCGKV